MTQSEPGYQMQCRWAVVELAPLTKSGKHEIICMLVNKKEAERYARSFGGKSWRGYLDVVPVNELKKKRSYPKVKQ